MFAFGFKDVLEHANFCKLRKEESLIVKGLILLGCWCIWKARNEVVFSNGRGRSEDILGDIKSLGFLWLKNRSRHKNLDRIEWCKYPMYMM
ncbi:hypothetical protein HanIR_Chr14g0674811 [Helianthus annuus]|nr:hypothetical protein HanIR_Chr14g0674811 [Helianthus annuus]